MLSLAIAWKTIEIFKCNKLACDGNNNNQKKTRKNVLVKMQSIDQLGFNLKLLHTTMQESSHRHAANNENGAQDSAGSRLILLNHFMVSLDIIQFSHNHVFTYIQVKMIEVSCTQSFLMKNTGTPLTIIITTGGVLHKIAIYL